MPVETSDQIFQLKRFVPALPRALKLLLNESGIVFALLLQECLMQTPQGPGIARRFRSRSSRNTFSAPAASPFISSAAPNDSRTGKNQSAGSPYFSVSCIATASRSIATAAALSFFAKAILRSQHVLCDLQNVFGLVVDRHLKNHDPAE